MQISRLRAFATCLAALVALATLDGQYRFREGRFPARFAPPSMPDGTFTFCRMMYDRVRDEPMGIGWVTDYPYAEINLMTRLSELTKTHGQPRRHRPAEPLGGASHRRRPLQLPVHDGVGRGHHRPVTGRARAACAAICSRADSCGSMTSGASAAWEHWASEIGQVLPPSDVPDRGREAGEIPFCPPSSPSSTSRRSPTSSSGARSPAP